MLLRRSRGYVPSALPLPVVAARPGARRKLVLATKVAGPSRGMPWIRQGAGMTGEDIVASCEGSLRRLKTDVIDLYQIHWPDRTTPVEEAMGAMEALRKQGVTFESLVIPDEIHGFLRHDSWLRVFQASADFFDRHLKGKAAPERHAVELFDLGTREWRGYDALPAPEPTPSPTPSRESRATRSRT